MAIASAAVMLGWVAVAVTVYVAVRWHSRCPRCKAPWRRFVAGTAYAPTGGAVTTVVCRNCGEHRASSERCYPSRGAAACAAALTATGVVSAAVAVWCVNTLCGG